MVSPASRRAVVKHLLAAHRFSDRHACRLAGLARSVWRYRSVRQEPQGFRDRMLTLATERPRFGYRRIHILLRREGFPFNEKRTRRIYREEKLQVKRRKRRKRAASAPREAMLIPEHPHQRWSMDFVSDRLGDGRTFRVLNVIDDHSRLNVALEPGLSIPGERVGRILDRAAAKYGWPSEIVVDNGPEFTSKALDRWAYERGITLYFIEPGKPTQNAFIESMNGKFREECLSETWFTSMRHVRERIATWRDDYNRVRPHKALGWNTPAEAERGALATPERLFGRSGNLQELQNQTL